MKLRKGFLVALGVILVSSQMISGSAFADLSKPVWPKAKTTLDLTNLPKPTDPNLQKPMPNDVKAFTLYKVPNKAGVVKYITPSSYGMIEKGPGVPLDYRYDLLENNKPISDENSKDLVNFFSMSDIHITDIQSPAQVLYFGKTPEQNSSAYSPQIPYSTQVLDGAVRKVNSISASSPENKMTFGLMLGDAINNAQQNELSLYLKVLLGGKVNPNTAPKTTYKTDYMKPFVAQGLKIPWYQVLGNHDHFWSGVYNANENLTQALPSDTVMLSANVLSSKELFDKAVYGGVIKVSDPYGKIVKDGPTNGKDASSHKIIPNAERKFLDAEAFATMFPEGHGIKPSSEKDPVGCYTFEPKSNLPLRVIVLDDTAKQDTVFLDNQNGTSRTTAANTSLSSINFKWLQDKLAQADVDKKLIIIAAHIPTGMNGRLWSPTSEITEKQFISELNSHPNVLMLMAGHRHSNTVIPYKSPDASKPELGFWQVETPSLRDFPQQFRIYKLQYNSNGTISIIITDVDPEGGLVDKARGYAIAAAQIFIPGPGLAPEFLPSRAYNAVLYKQLSPEMMTEMKKY